MSKREYLDAIAADLVPQGWFGALGRRLAQLTARAEPEPAGLVNVDAPPGTLGLVFKRDSTELSKVLATSPLVDKVQVGWTLVSVNGEDVEMLDGWQTTRLLQAQAAAGRKLSFAVPAGAEVADQPGLLGRAAAALQALSPRGRSEPTQPAVHYGTSFTRVWTIGCDATEGPVSIWRPDIAAPYVFFGDSVVRGGSAPSHRHVTMRDDEVDTKLMVPPVGFHRVVDQQRGGTVYVGEPVPPSSDYVALGDVATLTPPRSPIQRGTFPASDAWRGSLHRARHKGCGSRIWADAGTGGEDFAFFRAPTETLFVTMGPGRPGGAEGAIRLRLACARREPFSRLVGTTGPPPAPVETTISKKSAPRGDIDLCGRKITVDASASVA